MAIEGKSVKYLYLKILLLFASLSTYSTISAQEIVGYVLDELTNKPISSVNITDLTHGYKTHSDEKGYFSIIIKQTQKDVLLRFSFIGYESTKAIIPRSKTDTLLYIYLRSKNQHLNEVAITAPLRRQTLTESYSETTIDETIIEEKIATSLIDVLQEVPGITKRAEYHSPIALRGLGGKRLLVTKDGNRRMGNFSGSFMGQGVNIYDLAKVEVLKGPASVKYGPGAITGIINMVSKSPFLRPGWHGKASASYGTNNKERSVLGSINWANMDNALSISGRWRDADDFTAGKNIKAENTEYHDRDLRASYTWEGNNSLRLNTESELHIGGPWGRPIGFNGSDEMHVYNPHDNTWHTAISFIYSPETKLKKMEGSIYFDKEYRQQIKDSYDVGSGKLSYREDIRYSNYYGGWRYLSLFEINKQTELNIGTDGVLYRIKSPTKDTDYFLDTEINNRVSKNAGVILAGIFAEMEYHSKDGRLKIRAGLRADYSRINEGDVHDTLLTIGRQGNVTAWNSTVGIVYKVKNKFFTSFQIARSCRMPDASEMFIVNSTSDGVVYGNSDLKPEHGLNLDAGFRGTTGWMSFDMSLFCNFLHDFISQEIWTNSGHKGVCYSYFNVDKARIFGGELSFGMRIKSFLNPDNTLVYNSMYVYTQGDKLTDAPNWFSSGDPLRIIPPFNFNQEIALHRLINSSSNLYISGNVRFYATQHRIASSSEGGYVSPSYTLFGASAGYKHKGQDFDWNLRLHADNLADNQYRPFESLVYSIGRNVKLMFTIQF